ncbi:glucohydrolase [Bacillus thuringiensis serovar roskildiensis]|uniref:Glucohydrolase n=1 Tax=Bacillus thuringiensis serovar sooncheon TaxID=180891 RepID=A0A9Q5SII5_BACTU|nr:alpha-glucosidase [Bacillus thuringiensis]OTW70235.1 glucohydrolase [Bacillus thuringiensis serovar coreanensis]OTX47933.1 glucohydrolase [Bacillus thuringiensis serovar sooncheon]OTX54923.1 glucohydrolase [Bacillus thuringiensis serovar guiyangiensis]OTX68978.1 glucohydrolase [Bacillus thuringiensis serovar roskildiensis]
MNKTWWKEAVAYQIYPRSFMDSNGDGIGDLQGIIAKLDYLKDLGIDVIWICPMYKSPNDDNGYDISDYQDIMDEFGTMEDFDALLDEVHKRDMKLIIDLVINHTSDEHPWFIESRSSKDNPKRDWYIWHDGKDGAEPNNWESIFNGSAWEYDEVTGQYYLHLFSRKQPDLNWENKEVREVLYDTVNWWLDKGIDGFRVDAISHIKKEDGFKDMPNPKELKYVPSFDKHMNVDGIQPLLEELKENTFSKYDIMTVGEANGVKIEDAELWVGEEQGKFNMVFQFEHLSLWDAEKKKDLDVVGLKKVLTKWQKGLENKGWNALYIENHDKPRIVSTWGDDKQYWRESAIALGAMYFFMHGTPFIYQGQEIGMTNVQFPNIEDYDDVAIKNLYREKIAEGVSHQDMMEIIWASCRDNSRTPMHWNDETNAGFTTGAPWFGMNPNYKEINIEKQKNEENSIFNFYKKMIALKKEHDVLNYGTYDLLLEDDPQIYAYTRTLNDEKIVVMSNISKEEAVYNEGSFALERKRLLLNNYEVAEHEQVTTITLKPYETRVYRIS